MKTYKVVLLFLLLLGIYNLTGCSQINTVSELEFRITWDTHSGRGEAIYAIVESFNEAHESINVTMVSGNENRDEVIQELNEGSTDIYMTPYRFLKDEDINPSLLELNQVFEDEWVYFYDTILTMTGNNDERYGMPWIGHSMALVYNKDIVKRAGVKPEEWLSYVDMLEACQMVVEKTDQRGLGLIGADHTMLHG